MKEVDAAAPAEPVGRPRVGLVGFAELRREGLAAILCAEHRGAVYELIPLSVPAALRTPDLALVLIDAEGVNHLLELLATFRQTRPQLRPLVVGAPADHDMIAGVISAGAKGYLDDRATPSDVRMALEVVRDGSIWAPRRVLADLLHHAQEARREAEPVRFTERERVVLRLLVLGYPNREIAALMKVDEGTVKAHLSRLLRKAGVENRIALTMRAIERGWT